MCGFYSDHDCVLFWWLSALKGSSVATLKKPKTRLRSVTQESNIERIVSPNGFVFEYDHRVDLYGQ